LTKLFISDKFRTLISEVKMSKHTGHKNEHTKKVKKINWGWIIAIVLIAIVLVLLLVWPTIWTSIKPVGSIVVPSEVSRPMDKVPAGETAAGDPAAPVKLEVFSDYQCPACRVFSSDIEPKLLQFYVDTGKVYLIYRAYSFIDRSNSLQESHKAAEAAFCAMDQGAFWKYHDILFANQTGENVGDFVNKRLVAFADKLGLDTTKFQACLNSGKYTQRVEDEYQLGQKAGVDSTPSFYIDGQRFQLQTSYDELFQALDNAVLAKQK
jgi:protein-disulfide isomerase